MLRIHKGSYPLELATRTKRKLQENHALALLRCTGYGVGGAGVCDFWRGMRGLSGFRFVLAHLHLLYDEKTQLYKTWKKARRKQNICVGWKCWKWS